MATGHFPGPPRRGPSEASNHSAKGRSLGGLGSTYPAKPRPREHLTCGETLRGMRSVDRRRTAQRAHPRQEEGVSDREGRREWSRARQRSGRRSGHQQAGAHGSWLFPLPFCNPRLGAPGRRRNFCPAWHDICDCTLRCQLVSTLWYSSLRCRKVCDPQTPTGACAYLSRVAPRTGKKANPSLLFPI